MLNTSGAVVLGMVYNYVPYMILPLYTSMAKIDQSLVEAAQDLGASTTKTLLRVLIPHERARHQHRHHHGVRARRCPPLSSAVCWAAAPTCSSAI